MKSVPIWLKPVTKLIALALVFWGNNLHAQVTISDSCDAAVSRAKSAGWSDSRIAGKMKFEAENIKASDLGKLRDGYGVMSSEKFRDVLGPAAVDTGFYLCAAKSELTARANGLSGASTTASSSASQSPQPNAINNQSTQTSAAQTALSMLQTLQSIKSGGGTAEGSGLDTSASCRGKGDCRFQMPKVACGTYTQSSYPGGYLIEQTNTCSFDIVYRLKILKGPEFSSYGAHNYAPTLKAGQKFKGDIIFQKSQATKTMENYACRTVAGVRQMVGIRVEGMSDIMNKGCEYITAPAEVRTSQ